ncbi:DUF3450 family protein [Teredinibacter turnerae]|uniref:DUF3450 family protein n=1 Tax=Teredinibacter turnerae TaxID=2426 RepID=UPI00036B8A7C|nr:DUF3450 family protein [Teredinibacter turnerae]
MRGCLFSLIFVSLAGFAAPSIERTDSLMAQWLSLERQRGSLERNWQQRKAQLEQKQALFADEIQSLEKIIESAASITDDVSQRRLALSSEQDTLEQEQSRIARVIEQSSYQLEKVATQLPPPIARHWQEKMTLLSQSDVSNSEKLERLFSLLDQAEEFNQRIAVNEASMALEAGGQVHTVLVTQIFLGISQGWYVSADGAHYGFGRSTSSGWRWWHGDAADAELGRPLRSEVLLQLKAMLANPTTADYLSLPVKL